MSSIMEFDFLSNEVSILTESFRTISAISSRLLAVSGSACCERCVPHGVGHAMHAAEVEAGRRRGETVLPLPLTDLTNFGAPAALAPSNMGSTMGSTMGRSQGPGSALAPGLLGPHPSRAVRPLPFAMRGPRLGKTPGFAAFTCLETSHTARGHMFDSKFSCDAKL